MYQQKLHTTRTEPVNKIPPEVVSSTAAFFTNIKLFVGARTPSISRPSNTACWAVVRVMPAVLGAKEWTDGIVRRVRSSLFMVLLIDRGAVSACFGTEFDGR